MAVFALAANHHEEVSCNRFRKASVWLVEPGESTGLAGAIGNNRIQK